MMKVISCFLSLSFFVSIAAAQTASGGALSTEAWDAQEATTLRSGGSGPIACFPPDPAMNSELQDAYRRIYDILKNLSTTQREKLWEKILRPFFFKITGKNPDGAFWVLCNPKPTGQSVTDPAHLDKYKPEFLLPLLEGLIRQLRGLGVDGELDRLLAAIDRIRCASAGPLPPEDAEAIKDALKALKDGLNWLFYNLIVLPSGGPTLYPTRPNDVMPSVPPYCLARPEEGPIGPILVHPGLDDKLPGGF